MGNLIFGALATLAGYREGSDANLGSDLYYRCIVVSLFSAARQNPGCTPALVTNVPVPPPYAGQLAEAGVETWLCPFDRYRVDGALEWSLAFYKLCALDWVLEHRAFDRALLLDVDTFTQHPYTDLWREADEAVLLYQVPHAASQQMTAAISRNYDALWPEGAPHTLTHFGGELLCGSKPRLQAFAGLCAQVFARMQAVGLTPHEGDEAVTCAAAYRSLLAGQPVRAANAYIFRYWLGARFYFVSTNYCLDPVCILHLPGQGKARQLAVLYRYYTRHQAFPPLGRVHRLCCLPPAHPPLLPTLRVRLLARLSR